MVAVSSKNDVAIALLLEKGVELYGNKKVFDGFIFAIHSV